MVYRAPALLNINGTQISTSKIGEQKTEQSKSWQQVPINLYKNPKINNTLREFFVR